MPRISKKTEIQAIVQKRGWGRIGKQEWQNLRQAFAESTIRAALSEVDVGIDQPFAGVLTKTFSELEVSLVAMAEAYAAETDLQRECRAQVIVAKERARYAALNPKTAPEKRAVKEEMVQWMLIWLGDPAMFATWAALRKRAVYCSSTDST